MTDEERRKRNRERVYKWRENHKEEFREYMRNYAKSYIRNNPDKYLKYRINNCIKLLTEHGYRVIAPDKQ